ncbi:MAG: hypothetical protein QNJ70_04080 [Xenococcaceae cyanobacterium MO_207.B15]|nr:hypothetical protein [Xenococcaceae cyanobacterium MO_207.B15]MDJ0746461.1 hypothetical protein [Xenococcaceae cyanobacterium MO_167.B27]
MDLKPQLQILIDDAPNHGLSSVVIEKAIAPVLEILAQQLEHLEYYILQNLSDEWVVYSISEQDQNQSPKRVIYVFSAVQDAGSFQGQQDPNIIAVPLPITHILFRLFSLSSIDSMVFFTQPGNLNTAIELKRSDLQNLIQQQLQQLVNITNDIA